MKQVQNIIGAVLLLFFVTNSFGLYAQTEEGNVSVAQLKKLIDDKKDVQLLDVRTEQEYDQGNLYGAENINFLSSDFEEQIAKLDKNNTYYVYCFSGGRSAQAVAKMKSKGFKSVYNVSGGIRAWTQAGYDINGGTVVK